MEKLNAWRVGGAVIFVNSWMHGLDIAVLKSDKPWTIGGLALGTVNAALTGFFIGALFAWCRNVTAARAK